MIQFFRKDAQTLHLPLRQLIFFLPPKSQLKIIIAVDETPG
jgi:hypothetical protein